MGGVAGHAGLFSSARDLAVFEQMLLGGGADRQYSHCAVTDAPRDLVPTHALDEVVIGVRSHSPRAPSMNRRKHPSKVLP